jgi:hypothetical protein
VSIGLPAGLVVMALLVAVKVLEISRGRRRAS